MTNAAAKQAIVVLGTENDNEAPVTYTAHGVSFTAPEIDSEEMVDTLSKRLMEAHPYDVTITRFQRGDGFRGVQEATETAAKILAARLTGEDMDFDDLASDGYSHEYESAHTLVTKFIEEINENYLDDPDKDADTAEIARLTGRIEEHEDELIDAVLEIASDEDDSTPADLFYSNDYCEIALIFMPPDGAWDDYMFCQGDGYYSDISLNEQSLDVMQRLGIRVGEYRRHSGNKRKAEGNTRYPVGRKILELDQFKEIAENACSSFFLVVAYAHVPISRLIDIDFTQPITLDRWHVASWNPASGTFHDVKAEGPLVVTPGMGRWVIPGDAGYSPDDVCGFVSSYYQSDMKNG